MDGRVTRLDIARRRAVCPHFNFFPFPSAGGAETTEPVASAVALLAGTLLVACAPSAKDPEGPGGPELPQPDAQGIRVYDGYRTVVAGAGDSVSDLARRAGVPADTLAAFNGINTATALRAGDELVIPPS